MADKRTQPKQVQRVGLVLASTALPEGVAAVHLQWVAWDDVQETRTWGRLTKLDRGGRVCYRPPKYSLDLTDELGSGAMKVLIGNTGVRHQRYVGERRVLMGPEVLRYVEFISAGMQDSQLELAFEDPEDMPIDRYGSHSGDDGVPCCLCGYAHIIIPGETEDDEPKAIPSQHCLLCNQVCHEACTRIVLEQRAEAQADDADPQPLFLQCDHEANEFSFHVRKAARYCKWLCSVCSQLLEDLREHKAERLGESGESSDLG